MLIVLCIVYVVVFVCIINVVWFGLILDLLFLCFVVLVGVIVGCLHLLLPVDCLFVV